MYSFSTIDRDIILQQFQDQEFDVVIIGGGITGAGIALDAVSRGLKVALVEKGDFSQGTSSSSTKLVHGGLRYLKQGDFSLVKEVGRERAILHQNAPHLVVPEPMLIPIIEGGAFSKWQISIALWVYDWLADVRSDERRKMLSAGELFDREPLLEKENIKGGGAYFEYRTDDSRLTIEVIKTAINYGAHCINYMKAQSFTYEGEVVNGVKVKDLDKGDEFVIKGKVIVNATGPWVDQIRQIDNHKMKGKLRLTKGVHIVVEQKKLPIVNAIYFTIPDGRMAFVIPREGMCYIGTTDTIYDTLIDQPKVTLKDVYYLLDAVNAYFLGVQLGVDDVVSSWVGLRPLIYKTGKGPSELSRQDELFVSDNGLVSIAGGKLTGYRTMAERVVNRIVKILSQKFHYSNVPCRTEFISLQGGVFRSNKELESYKEKIQSILSELNFEEKWANYLIHRYGRQSGVICHHLLQMKGSSDIHMLQAELWFSVKNELVYSLLDFLERRSGRLYFNPSSIKVALPYLLSDCVIYFKWNKERVQLEEKKVLDRLKAITDFVVIDS